MSNNANVVSYETALEMQAAGWAKETQYSYSTRTRALFHIRYNEASIEGFAPPHYCINGSVGGSFEYFRPEELLKAPSLGEILAGLPRQIDATKHCHTSCLCAKQCECERTFWPQKISYATEYQRCSPKNEIVIDPDGEVEAAAQMWLKGVREGWCIKNA